MPDRTRATQGSNTQSASDARNSPHPASRERTWGLMKPLRAPTQGRAKRVNFGQRRGQPRSTEVVAHIHASKIDMRALTPAALLSRKSSKSDSQCSVDTARAV